MGTNKDEGIQIELFSPAELQNLASQTEVRSFLPSAFITAALPLRDIKRNSFVRKYNNIQLTLSSGASSVPFGVYGRLLLSILTTHAVVDEQSDNGTVKIYYENLQHLLNELKVEKQRGKKVLDQLELFSKSTFIYEEKTERNSTSDEFPQILEDVPVEKRQKVDVKIKNKTTGLMPFLNGFRFTEIEDNSGNKKNISFEIVLNERFVQLCQTHSVPIDYTVYSSIQSPLGKDLYAWIVYRNNILGDKPIFIPRQNLVNQFVPISSNVKDVKAMERNNYNLIKERIEEIKEKYYPGLNVVMEKDGSGMTLYKSAQIINPNDQRYMLVTSTIK